MYSIYGIIKSKNVKKENNKLKNKCESIFKHLKCCIIKSQDY
jgi:hypothetical protein